MSPEVLKYRGRSITEDDVRFLVHLIGENAMATRRSLSKVVCEAWGWRQSNGQLRDMVCRGLMLVLHRRGLIQLPKVKRTPVNNVIRHREAADVTVDQAPIACELRGLAPVEFRLVRRSPDERLFNGLLRQHHYLGYVRPVGEHLKYLIVSGDRPIACLAWSSAPRHLGPRDRFIGWKAPARRRNIRFLAYNTRYLVMPWVRVPHLASHLLGRCARRIDSDWQSAYGHPILYLESFVEPGRFLGTCYRAANWRFLGKTLGLGKASRTKIPDRTVKEVLGFPLCPNFREILGGIG